MSLSDYYHSAPISKPTPVVKAKPRRRGITAWWRARKARKDKAVADRVRDLVIARDGYCRYGKDVSPAARSACWGMSEWAHVGEKKRFKTRGQAPEIRHTRAGSFTACTGHHRAYDEHRLAVEAITDAGCDGALQYKESK